MSKFNDATAKSIYLELDKWTPGQLHEIILGLQQGVDVSKYLDPLFNAEHMRFIRLALLNDSRIDNSGTKTDNDETKPDNSWHLMQKAFIAEGFSSDQSAVLATGIKQHVDISWYTDKRFSAEQMHVLKEAQLSGVDISDIAAPNVSVQDMEAVIMCYKRKIECETNCNDKIRRIMRKYRG